MSRLLSGLCALAACALLACGAGCSTTQVTLAEGPREYVATDYENVLKEWTRTEHLVSISELENFLTATATFDQVSIAAAP